MVRIITETTCDVSLEILNEWNVETLPMFVTLDGAEYRDQYDISPVDFFDMLEKTEGLPTTTQITPNRYEAIMKDVKDKKEEALFLVFSSGLSGSYQSCLVAQQMVDYEGIRVVDTKAACGGQGLIVYEIQKRAAQGLSLAELTEAAEWMSTHIEHLVMVENLEMLRRGGRISGVAAFMGGVMNIKPLIHMVDGKLLPFAKVKGQRKALKHLILEMEKRGKDLEQQKIFITHAANPKGAQMLADELKEMLGLSNIFITEMGATIGSHTGRGAVTLYFFSEAP
ncbi:DegV family protein [Clostridia bacterium]|nr:DegV family protein [Clostridia bacterium]